MVKSERYVVSDETVQQPSSDETTTAPAYNGTLEGFTGEVTPAAIEAYWKNRTSGSDRAHAAETKVLRDRLASLEGAGGQPPKSSADASPEVAETIKRLQAEVLQERTARILETRRAKYPNAIAALGDDVAAQMDEARLAGLNEQLNATAAPKVDPNNPARRATGPKPISELTDAELRERFRATPVPGRS